LIEIDFISYTRMRLLWKKAMPKTPISFLVGSTQPVISDKPFFFERTAERKKKNYYDH